ncbi:FkbM family methyltransferase [Affinirhizobium pseudoryzae]|uniref:FkbM family methyltransferase n=1 Tax=Allorhizobium pseudoryzae TaxID=379684 RepID=UPI001EEE0443|nr:FkbM family methyltransferase [Allorhizobium pseudoryzae]
MTGNLAASFGLARSIAIYYGMPWRRSSLKRFYRALVKPGDLVFDIGAHVGSRSRTLLQLGARVVAVEPQPLFADFLHKHLEKDLVALERVAVGRESGEIDLHISSRHPTVTSISTSFVETAAKTPGFASVEWDRTLKVPMVTLADLVQRYGMPDFCKIDVEGAEADILNGVDEPLPLVAFEYIPSMPHLTDAALAALASRGDYRFNRVVGESHRFVEPEWTGLADLQAKIQHLAPDAPSGDIYARLSR